MLRTVFLLLLLASVSSGVLAQSAPEFTHTFVSTRSASLPARDFWFTMPKNYESQAGKYYQLYVTSRQATTINIQVQGGTATKKAIKPQEVFAFMIPLAWEVTSSGIVEDLGIHVWSDDADLTVHLLSRNPATSGGMNIIPVSAWGKQYIVAAYHSIYEGVGTIFDYPTEFAIVASDDSTHVTIIPTVDIRKSGLKNEVLHKANDTFTVVLNSGEVVQYMATEAQNADDYDFTGTIVTSTKPIGVFGASQCANIPPEYPYCDYVGEMLLPVDSWGQTYHSVPFYNLKGGDSFCMIASKDNQTIYFNGMPVSSLNRFEPLFRPDITQPGTWTSDAPFLLTQYINSTEWPDPVTGQTNNGIGDPAMVALNPTELYTNDVLFQAPFITSGTGFTHYAVVVVHTNAIASTALDGIPIQLYPSTHATPIPNSSYTAFTTRSIKSGSHRVTSDSGVTAQVYGYGSYDAYAWNGSLGLKRPVAPDTVAPTIVATTGDCFCARVSFNEVHPNKSGLVNVVVDSSSNIEFTKDALFVIAADSSYYDICIIDPSKEGYIRTSIYDIRGNRTVVQSRIDARSAPTVSSERLTINYVGASIPEYADVTLTNTTGAPLPLQGPSGLRFTGSNKGFDVVTTDLSDLAPGASRILTVRYSAPDSVYRRDTLLLGHECNRIMIILQSRYLGRAVPLADLYNFGCIDFGTTKDSLIRIYAVVDTLTIDTMWIDNTTYFTILDLPTFPFVIQQGGHYDIRVLYQADKLDTVRSTLRVITVEHGESHTTVQGCAVLPGGVRTEISITEADLRSSLERGNTFAWLAPSPNPAERISSVRFVFGLSRHQSVGLELFDLLGKQVAVIPQQSFDGGLHELSLETRSLVSGTYIYRYLVNGIPYSGMLTIR